MFRQNGIPLSISRFLFSSLFAIVLLLVCSILITILGSNTVLAAKGQPDISFYDVSANDSPNFVTIAGSALMQDSQSVLILTGRALYGASHSTTVVATQAGKATLHGSAVVMQGVGHVVASAGRQTGSGIMFVLRLPAKAVAPLTHSHGIKAVIQPTDSAEIPVINEKTSAALLAQYNASQQKEITKLLDEQILANRELGGTIIAGDPNHGGYPSKWDNASQDSLLDSWGMYNRECVSYAAWKVYQTFGHMPYWGGVGNANQWVADARNAGIATGQLPKVHSVAISMSGYYGHAMWVEAVRGRMIYVSQYNYDLQGHYSEMWLDGSNLTYIYF